MRRTPSNPPTDAFDKVASYFFDIGMRTLGCYQRRTLRREHPLVDTLNSGSTPDLERWCAALAYESCRTDGTIPMGSPNAYMLVGGPNGVQFATIWPHASIANAYDRTHQEAPALNKSPTLGIDNPALSQTCCVERRATVTRSTKIAVRADGRRYYHCDRLSDRLHHRWRALGDEPMERGLVGELPRPPTSQPANMARGRLHDGRLRPRPARFRRRRGLAFVSKRSDDVYEHQRAWRVGRPYPAKRVERPSSAS